jgi:hypothetical protein
MLRTLALLAGIVALLGTAMPALAQTKGPHGGMVAAGKEGHQTELVVRGTEVTVYLLHEGQTHESTGTSLRAVIQQSGKTTTVSLVDQGGERLVGKLAAPLAKGAIVVLTGKDHHGHAISARYVIP